MTDEERYECLRLDRQICFPLYACSRKITSGYTPYLKPLGITYTQYLVFLVLWEKDGITVGDLCRRLYLDSGTVTPLLKKMEEHGFITRVRCQNDERCVQVHLTDAGMDMREKAKDIPQKIGACVPLDPQESQTLYRLLYKILETEK